jgi:DNA-binding MarR family transcriptional regulator
VPSPDAVRAAQDLRAVVGRLRRRLLEVHTPDELAAGAVSVLLRLEKGGPTTAAVLAAAERIRPQSMGTKIAALEDQGLLTRHPDPDDGRRLVVELTDAGRARVAVDRAARGEWLAQAFEDRYTADERAVMVHAFTLLDRLLDE